MDTTGIVGAGFKHLFLNSRRKEWSEESSSEPLPASRYVEEGSRLMHLLKQKKTYVPPQLEDELTDAWRTVLYKLQCERMEYFPRYTVDINAAGGGDGYPCSLKFSLPSPSIFENKKEQIELLREHISNYIKQSGLDAHLEAPSTYTENFKIVGKSMEDVVKVFEEACLLPVIPEYPTNGQSILKNAYRNHKEHWLPNTRNSDSLGR